MRPRDVRGVICEFECGYEFAGSPVMQELERSVLGSDYGATSWMPERQAMLRGCRRVARDGARMAFSVIAVAQLIEGAQRRVALDSGPAFVESEDYAILLDRSGWRLLERDDISSDFAGALKARSDGIDARYAAIADLRGPQWVSEALERLHDTLSAVERGLLRREAYCAVASG